MATEPKKIFVGGLNWETTKASLEEYFTRWGKVTDSVIMQDNEGKPRGFGFVTFSEASSVTAVLSHPEHILDGKKIDPKLAVSPSSDQKAAQLQGRVNKVFVGGIPAETTADDIRETFKCFGKIVDVELKYDKATKRMRGFGFVEFEDEDDAEKIVQKHHLLLNGKEVEVKKAEPRYASQMSQAKSFGQPNYSQAYNNRAYMQGYVQPYNQAQGFGNYAYGGGSFGQNYNQVFSQGGYGQANYGQTGYGYGPQGQSYGYGGGFDSSGSEQRGDSYGMQRTYQFTGKEGQQPLSGSYSQESSAYTQGGRTGYPNSGDYPQQGGGYTGYVSNESGSTGGYSSYHGGEKQGSSFSGTPRGGQPSRGPQYGGSSFGGGH